MKKISKYILKAILIIATVAGCVYGGRIEYNDCVESSISAEKYQYIQKRIGCTSRSEIIDEYMKNKVYYDSIQY